MTHEEYMHWLEAHLQRIKGFPVRKPRPIDRFAVMRTQAIRHGRVTKAEWHAILLEFNYRCANCGTNDRRIVRDHIVPISLGGLHIAINIQPLCDSCNVLKGDRIIDYRQIGDDAESAAFLRFPFE